MQWSHFIKIKCVSYVCNHTKNQLNQTNLNRKHFLLATFRCNNWNPKLFCCKWFNPVVVNKPTSESNCPRWQCVMNDWHHPKALFSCTDKNIWIRPVGSIIGACCGSAVISHADTDPVSPPVSDDCLYPWLCLTVSLTGHCLLMNWRWHSSGKGQIFIKNMEIHNCDQMQVLYGKGWIT